MGPCLDHPQKGKSQLFRKCLKDPKSLFDNPRQHTGKGYYKKTNEKQEEEKQEEKRGTKRKAENGQSGPIRACVACGETIDQFSKNQRGEESNARCKKCV